MMSMEVIVPAALTVALASATIPCGPLGATVPSKSLMITSGGST